MHKGINAYMSSGSSYGDLEDATPHRLIEVLYENALSRLYHAKGCIQEENLDEAAKQIDKTIMIISYLRSCLDMEQGQDLAQNLDLLYDYVQRGLLLAGALYKEKYIDDAITMLTEVKAGWSEIRDEANEFSTQMLQAQENADVQNNFSDE